MKKSTIMICILFVAFFLLGCVFTGAGVLMGGGAQLLSWASEGKLWGISPVTGIVRDEISDVRAMIRSDLFDVPMTGVSGETGGVKIDGKVSRMVIEVGAANLEIKKGGDEVSLEYENVEGLKYSLTDGVLYIEEAGTAYVSKNGKVELHIPSGTELSDVDLKLGAGEVKIKDLSAGTLSVNVGAGDCKIEDAKIGNLITNVGFGRFKFEGKVSGDITAELASGEIELEVDGDEEDFNYDISCGLGDVKVGDLHMSGAGNSKTINNGASANCKLEVAMGSLKMKFD